MGADLHSSNNLGNIELYVVQSLLFFFLWRTTTFAKMVRNRLRFGSVWKLCLLLSDAFTGWWVATSERPGEQWTTTHIRPSVLACNGCLHTRRRGRERRDLTLGAFAPVCFGCKLTLMFVWFLTRQLVSATTISSQAITCPATIAFSVGCVWPERKLACCMCMTL